MQEIIVGKEGKEREFKKAVAFSKDAKNLKRVIGLFTIALDDVKFRTQAVDYLVDLYIKMGNYKQAREILKKYGEESNLLSWAKIEIVENNYQASKTYYEQISDKEEKQNVKFALARIEFQLGRYKQGREILESLRYDSKYTVQSIFEECYSYMMDQNYEKGYMILKSMRTNNFKSDQAEDYKSMEFYFSYYLGKMSKQEIEDNLNQGYWIFRLLCDSDTALLKHISYHTEGEKNAGLNPFINMLDLKTLLEEVRKRTSDLNPNHLYLMDQYRFKMDRPIGYVDGIPTNDICVSNILGTDRILTMYPVLLSDEFDREGNSTSERLRRKRDLGRKN